MHHNPNPNPKLIGLGSVLNWTNLLTTVRWLFTYILRCWHPCDKRQQK